MNKVPVVLVGNKCDMRTDRAVEEAEGEGLAKKWGCPFFEASAKTKVCAVARLLVCLFVCATLTVETLVLLALVLQVNNEICFLSLVREVRKHTPGAAGGGGSDKPKPKSRCSIL